MKNKTKSIWIDLNKSIYVGERLQKNLAAITYASIISMVFGLAMVILNTARHAGPVVITSWAFLFGGIVSAISAHIYGNRIVSVITAMLIPLVAFTYYAISGGTNGVSIMWSLLMPVGASYFLGVKFGIISSIYLELLYIVLFYTPIRQMMTMYYSDELMTRFPIVFLCTALFTMISMFQYHQMVLRDIEYADRLSAEVAKQTEVANERARKLENMSEEVVSMMAVAIDAKDKYTNGHSFRVSAYSVAIAEHLGWSDEEIREMRREGMLHDIGKIGIPDSVLNKPDKLTNEEFNVIKSHTTIGGKILKTAESLLKAADVALYHHERYDGRGYPSGLEKENIPIRARIVSIADAYDAMRSDRIYRKGLSPEAIRMELIRGRGTQFDPELLDVFLKMVDNGELDLITEQANKQLSEAVEIGLIEKASDWIQRNKEGVTC